MKRYCVIGYPARHSLSPKIHNASFKKHGLPARYELAEVKPAKLRVFMRRFCERFSGANVTIPHKEKIIRYLDALSPQARAIGAVNTIVKRGGKLHGYNTDADGVSAALKGLHLRDRKAIVLGAGGAARAVVYVLRRAGAQVTLLNRTLSHAKKIAAQFKCAYTPLKNFNPRESALIVNTTSVGMWPQSKATPLPNLTKSLRQLKKKPVVMDIIYRPRITKLLRDAEKAGCKIISGEKMFHAQAARSFELWLRALQKQRNRIL